MYDKQILAKSTGASLGVVAVVGMLFLSTGTALAAPISGIGGFKIRADRLAGDDIILYPGTGNTENVSMYPQGIVELNGVEIQNLRLIKTFHLTQYGFSSGAARLVITAGNSTQNVTSGQLLLKTPELSATKAVFSGLTVTEKDTPDTKKGIKQMITLRAPDKPSTGQSGDLPGGPRQISLSGGSNPGVQMRNANIRATYLATNTITLPHLGLEVQYSPNDNDFTDAGDYT
ncbi:MAG: DUF6230 family protein [Halorientalis sp.]